MCTHPELGCGRDCRFDDHRAGADAIILPSPPSDQHLGFLHISKDLSVEEFIPEFSIEALVVAILPGACQARSRGFRLRTERATP